MKTKPEKRSEPSDDVCPICMCRGFQDHRVSKVAPSAEYPYELRTITTCPDCGGVWESEPGAEVAP